MARGIQYICIIMYNSNFGTIFTAVSKNLVLHFNNLIYT